MIRCLAFDFDGTLAQSNSVKRNAYYEIAEAFGDLVGVVDDVLAKERGTRHQVIAALVSRLEKLGRLPDLRSPREWVDYLVREYTLHCEKHIAICPEVPGTMAALERLSALGYPLYINSATPTEPLERILGLRNMKHLFKGIFGTPSGKSENLLKVIAAENIPPSALAFVGDNEVDRLAAGEIGCRFIGLENEFSGYAVPPSCLIRDQSELLTALWTLDGRVSDTVKGKHG
jgi:phosphoglycolate phosphatase-like HAD superfamily hydrolase